MILATGGLHCPAFDAAPPSIIRLGGAVRWRPILNLRADYPPVHMIRLTEQREITPYRWVHPDEDL